MRRSTSSSGARTRMVRSQTVCGMSRNGLTYSASCRSSSTSGTYRRTSRFLLLAWRGCAGRGVPPPQVGMGSCDEPAPAKEQHETPPLPDEAVVIRFGLSAPETLRKTALAHHDERGDFAISAFSLPDADAETLAHLGALAHPRIRETTVGRIRAVGYDVVPDPPPDGHALIMLPRLPTDTDWTTVADTFDPPRQNPATETQGGAGE
jgi:hypothetical protein